MKSTTAMIVIAAMLMTPIAMVLSTGFTSAAHTATISITPSRVRGGENVILDVTVTNSGDSVHAISKVRVTIPSGWSKPYPVVRIPKENDVYVDSADNIVYIPAGTTVLLIDNDNIFLPENTVVIVKENKWVWVPALGQTQLLEDVEVKIAASGGTFTENVDWENFEVATDVSFGYPVGTALVVDQDILAIKTGPSIVMLPENAKLRTVGDMNIKLSDNAVKPATDITAVIKDNAVTLVTDRPQNVMNWTLPSGRSLQLIDNEVVIPAGTLVQLTRATTFEIIRVSDNTVVIRKKGQELDVSAATVENIPSGWSASSAATYVEWTGGQIAPGSTVTFKIAVESATSSGLYNFTVTTTDTTNLARNWTTPVEVDSNPPVLTLEVDKSWVGGSENVTIKLKGNESFTFENVEIWENGMAPRLLTLTPNEDNTEWTGVYTTENTDYWDNDGYITVRVNKAKDVLGNENTVAIFADKIFVDRRRPIAPSLTGIGLSVGIENKNDYVVNVTLSDTDDNLVFTPSGYTPEGLKLEVLLDNEVVASGVADWTGLVSFELTIPDGKHKIAARIIDKAGNIGEESIDNLVVDTRAPNVTVEVKENVSGESISDGGYANENVLVIKVTFSDEVLGIENKLNWPDLFENENLDNGYVVVLKAIDNKGVLPADNFALLPKIYPVEENVENAVPNVFLAYVLENTIHLPEGTYEIVAIAGDSMFSNYGKGAQRTKVVLRFTVDITPPSAPVLTTTQYVGTTKESPERSRRFSYTISGTAEAGATVRVLANLYNFRTGQLIQSGVVLGSTTAGSDNRWTIIIDISQYQGKVVEVLTETIDVAGNVSTSRTSYGYLLYDASAPRVTIDAKYKNMKTGQSSVVIEGTITIDEWETYDDITVTVSPAGASVNLDRATGKFTASIPLAEGKNQITITATDLVGNSGSDAAIITKTVTPWATYAIVIVIIALILAAIAIFRRA